MKILLSPTKLNELFKNRFSFYGWRESRINYFVNEDLAVTRDIIHLREADFFYERGDIDVGVEIIPTHNMMSKMSTGVAWYENELTNIVREGRSNPSVPIVLIGVEP